MENGVKPPHSKFLASERWFALFLLGLTESSELRWPTELLQRTRH